MSSSLRDDNDSDNDDDKDDFIVTSTVSTIVEQKKEIDIDIVDAVFRGKSRSNNSNSKINNNQEDIDLPVLTRINNFLNQPFFDPEKYDDDDNSFFGKFARLIKNDYEFFETVYVGCFFIILIIITQDVLRAQMHTHTRF